MNNKEKYNSVFTKIFDIQEDILPELKYQSIENWDSVGHMTMVAEIEEKFEIEMDIDDIIDFSSYKRGVELLKKYGVDI